MFQAIEVFDAIYPEPAAAWPYANAYWGRLGPWMGLLGPYHPDTNLDNFYIAAHRGEDVETGEIVDVLMYRITTTQVM